MRITKLTVITLFCSLLALQAQADSLAVIVNTQNSNNLDERTIRQIFLGQINTFPDGLETRTFDTTQEGDLRSDFITKVLRRNENTMNAYWARMIFTARATPPQELPDSAAVKQAVANTRGGIGYIATSAVDDSVRVILTID